MSEETNIDESAQRDWVQEAYECFCKDQPDETDPVAVIRRHFETTADDELKAKCAADGKTPEGALAFMMAVQGKIGNGCISDSVGLAICMHYFQDVPALAEFEPELKKAERERLEAERKAKAAEKATKLAAEATDKAKKAKAKYKTKKEEQNPTQTTQGAAQDAFKEKTNNEPSKTEEADSAPPQPVQEQTTLFDSLFA